MEVEQALINCMLTSEIEQKNGDARWLNKATELVRLKIKDKNKRAARVGRLKVPLRVPQPQPMEAILMSVIPESRLASASIIWPGGAVKVVRSAPAPECIMQE